MKINKINVSLEPHSMSPDKIEMKIMVNIDDKKAEISKVYEPNDFDSMFDTYFAAIQKTIKDAIRES